LKERAADRGTALKPQGRHLKTGVLITECIGLGGREVLSGPMRCLEAVLESIAGMSVGWEESSQFGAVGVGQGEEVDRSTALQLQGRCVLTQRLHCVCEGQGEGCHLLHSSMAGYSLSSACCHFLKGVNVLLFASALRDAATATNATADAAVHLSPPPPTHTHTYTHFTPPPPPHTHTHIRDTTTVITHTNTHRVVSTVWSWQHSQLAAAAAAAAALLFLPLLLLLLLPLKLLLLLVSICLPPTPPHTHFTPPHTHTHKHTGF
jgi:hypothetical protein